MPIVADATVFRYLVIVDATEARVAVTRQGATYGHRYTYP